MPVVICLKEEIDLKKELPIVVDPGMNNMLCYTYPLSIALAYEEFIPWVQENYILCCGVELFHNNGFARPTYYIDATTFIDCGNRDLFTYNSYSQDMLSKTNLVGSIIRNIDKGKYCILHVDEFYLPTCNLYNEIHFLHEQLIFGYDTDSGTLKAMGMNNAKQYDILYHTFTDFENAYEAGFDGDLHANSEYIKNNCLFTIAPITTIRAYPYSVNKFKNKLIQYLNSDISESEKFLLQLETIGIPYVGMNYYDFVILSLQRTDHTMLFRKLHHLWSTKEVCIIN